MHGEYKVRGGKLVRADVETQDGRITAARVFGDFFLEPDSALEDIDAALIGLPASSSAEQIAAAVAARLDPRTRLIGFDVDAVGVAVRRALGGAIGWEDLTFDVIGARTMHPAMHVALDEVIAGEVGKGLRNPTFRLWDWDAGVVVIGSFQSVRNEVDPEGLAAHRMTVVRRITGGGAMFMQPGACVTYSLVVPGSLVEGLTYEQSYAFLDEWVLGALASVGVQARHVPLNDIATDAGKIGGAAQRRFADGTVLHHATMSCDIDADAMVQVLRIGREKLSDKGTTSANKRVDPMRTQTDLPREQIMQAFVDYFRSQFRCVDSDYTPDELAAARELVRTKFAAPEWTNRVP
ncbi:MAG: lipoate--protein ligase family protein [Propionibacteriaceae bacterium]|nr:lipoate--protein ligase family protein [Propionibacteriaceae bacterium]